MVELATLRDDPAWLPHRVDPDSRKILFLRINRDSLSRRPFLAVREALHDRAWASFDDVVSMRPDPGPLRFIFHSGFCRSTLLVRALDIAGVSAGLNEPGILNSLAQSGPAADRLVKPILDLLSRPHAPGEAIVVKPSNFPNEIIPALMRARPDARAIVMTNSLQSFLAAVVRKGLEGRVWGRQVLLAAQRYAGDRLDIAPDAVAGMTDLQAAGLAWLMEQMWFADCLAGEHADRYRVLNGDWFDGARAQALFAAGEFLDLHLSRSQAEAIVQGEVFAFDAKSGRDFIEKRADDERRSFSAVVQEEMAEVGRWVANLAAQARITVPVPQTLNR